MKDASCKALFFLDEYMVDSRWSRTCFDYQSKNQRQRFSSVSFASSLQYITIINVLSSFCSQSVLCFLVLCCAFQERMFADFILFSISFSSYISVFCSIRNQSLLSCVFCSFLLSNIRIC